MSNDTPIVLTAGQLQQLLKDCAIEAVKLSRSRKTELQDVWLKREEAQVMLKVGDTKLWELTTHKEIITNGKRGKARRYRKDSIKRYLENNG